jgi:hypothetical protein
MLLHVLLFGLLQNLSLFTQYFTERLGQVVSAPASHSVGPGRVQMWPGNKIYSHRFLVAFLFLQAYAVILDQNRRRSLPPFKFSIIH